jgi:hypothetical protein
MNMDMDMSHKTGYFSGHAVAATGFVSFGTFFLCLTLKRVRNLPHGISFSDAHIPEKNSSVLLGGGLVLIPLTLFGLYFEAPGWGDWDSIVPPMTHISLYLSYMFVGISALLEGLKRLPQESARGAVVLALLLNYILWNEHALMKEVPADFRLHELLAQICLVAAADVAYSIKYPQNVFAYIMQPGICILMGLWLYTGGIYAAFIDIPVGMIGILLCWEALFVATIILLGAAFLVPKSYDQPRSYLCLTSVPGGEQIDEACCSTVVL